MFSYIWCSAVESASYMHETNQNQIQKRAEKQQSQKFINDNLKARLSQKYSNRTDDTRKDHQKIIKEEQKENSYNSLFFLSGH